jgi:hypothetical protein
VGNTDPEIYALRATGEASALRVPATDANEAAEASLALAISGLGVVETETMTVSCSESESIVTSSALASSLGEAALGESLGEGAAETGLEGAGSERTCAAVLEPHEGSRRSIVGVLGTLRPRAGNSSARGMRWGGSFLSGLADDEREPLAWPLA